MKIIRQHFSSIDSTNTWGKQHVHELSLDHMTLITADTQTAGRGRFKRKWESPSKQNIYASFCFFIEKNPNNNIGHIPQLLAISTATILKKLHLHPELKWPNDILLSGKKVAGILAETTPFSNKLCLIIGIGLNVNMPLEILQKIDKPATSLKVETGEFFEVEKILQELAEQFIYDLNTFFTEGFSPFLEVYRQLMFRSSNKIIHFHDNRRIWEGTLHTINQDGSLSLKLPSGELKTFIAGEIL